MDLIEPIAVSEILAARQRIAGTITRTPLIRLNADIDGAEIYLKLENLQPIGSFKLRGASNAMAVATPDELKNGVYTASAGNMAQGVAWNAKRMGIPCTVIVPESAPATKLDAIERLGARYIKLPFAEWWQVLVDAGYQGQPGLFVHPVSNRHVIAGNGTIGLEIIEDLPDVDTVIIPYGGGGLSSGIASAVKSLKPDTKLYAAEVDTSAAFSAALNAGEPSKIEYRPSFVDGIGSTQVLPEMFALARQLLERSIVVTLEEVAGAIRLMVERNRTVAEGAGAAAVAAALSGRGGGGKVVAVVSGGNIDAERLAAILRKEI